MKTTLYLCMLILLTGCNEATKEAAAQDTSPGQVQGEYPMIYPNGSALLRATLAATQIASMAHSDLGRPAIIDDADIVRNRYPRFFPEVAEKWELFPDVEPLGEPPAPVMFQLLKPLGGRMVRITNTGEHIIEKSAAMVDFPLGYAWLTLDGWEQTKNADLRTKKRWVEEWNKGSTSIKLSSSSSKSVKGDGPRLAASEAERGMPSFGSGDSELGGVTVSWRIAGFKEGSQPQIIFVYLSKDGKSAIITIIDRERHVATEQDLHPLLRALGAESVIP